MDELVELLGESPAIHVVRDKLRRLLDRQRAGQRLPPILLQGATGTGKGMVARLLHRHGARRNAPFVDVNCAAIPETLLEAELFGFEQGAFTDARRPKRGLFQAAHGGVLFLDEVSLLSAPAQAKLLTVIEERAVRRLGSTRVEAADVWLISATNADLRAAVSARGFRDDLYHRLAVVTFDLPPLCARPRDILLLAEHFLTRTCAEYGLPPMRLDPAAQARLVAYPWPGNVRELANVIERTALLADAPVVTAHTLGPLEADSAAAPAPESSRGTEVSRDEALRRHLLAALEQSDWNISLTAARLGIARNTVYARLEKFGLRPDGPHKALDGPPTTLIPAPESPPSDSGLHWERRSITLLRVDLASTDRVDAWPQSSRALEHVIAKVQSFGGRVEELTPNCLIAAFGLDSAEDAPRRAGHTAIAIQKGAARTPGIGDGQPAITIGLHVTSLLLGRVGTRIEIDAASKRAQWPVLDQLLHAQPPGETVATEAAAPFLERRFELVPLAASADDRAPAYRLTGRERRGLGLWGQMTRFVGRRQELEVLRGGLTRARTGKGQVVAVVGEAGIGKSRLVFEVAHSHLVDGWLVLEASSLPFADKTSYLPVANLLRGYFEIAERDTHPEMRNRITDRLQALDPELEPTLPALLALLDVPIEDPHWQRLAPSQRRQRTLEAVKRLLLRESRIQPLLIVFEDLAHIDSETQALLDILVESVPTAQMLLLVNYRPEYRHAWGSKAHYTQLWLDPLSSESADELLEALLGPDPALAPLRTLLTERTGRNPLFIEESVRTLVESQVLRGERGAYRLARAVDTIQVPPTVQAILAARINRLPSEDRWLLETAAVIGMDVPFALLQTVADTGEETLRRRLEDLQAAELLYQTRVLPEVEYTFKHPLTHEVTYESVLPDRRRALHAEIATVIEHCYSGRLTEHIERLAHHTLQGEVWEAAVRYLRQAGNKAAARSALREAVWWFEHALSALSHLPEDRGTLEQAFDLRFELRHAVGNQGDQPRAVAYLRDAAGLAEKLGDDRRLGRVYAFMVNGHNLLGDMDEAIACGGRALEIAEALGDLELRIVATTYLEQTCVFLGEFQRAVDLAKTNLSILPTDAVDQRFGTAMPPSVFDRGWLVVSLAQLGRFAEATEVAETSIRIAERACHPISIAWAHHSAGNVHAGKGDWSRARTLYDRAIEAIREGQWFLQLAPTLAASSRVLASLGESGEAENRAREAERLLDPARAGWRRAGSAAGPLTSLGHTYLMLGRLEDALRMVDRALEGGTPASEAHVRHLQGEIFAHPDRWQLEAAEDCYRRAQALAEERGMRPLVALCHLGLAKLYRCTDDGDRARAHLVTATTMFRDMNMGFWLEQGAVETKALG